MNKILISEDRLQLILERHKSDIDNVDYTWMSIDEMEKNPSIGGAIGGRFKYQFIPTGVGTVGTVIDTFTQDRFTFRDL